MMTTRDEWDEEQRRHAEFNRKFDEKQAERKRLGVESPPGGRYSSPDSIWERSFVSSHAADFPAMRIFAIGSHLAELVVDLKEPPSEEDPDSDSISGDDPYLDDDDLPF